MRQPGSESEKTEDGWRETKKKKKKKNYWWCFTAVAISNSALISIQCNESNYLLQLKNKSIIGIVMDNSSNIEMGPVHIVVSSPISWWYYCYNAVSPKETCIVNAYCQFSKQACTNFMQTILVFVNINPFLYINDQFALYDTPLLNRPRIQIAGTSLDVSQPWCLAPASFGGIREEK